MRSTEVAEVERAGVERHLGGVGRLVGVAHAGELRDLAGERLLVEALRVAADALLERRRDVDLDEVADGLARRLARRLVRRDGRDEHGHAVAREQVRDEGDARDVEVAVLAREAEALREMRADEVAVEELDLAAACARGAQLAGEGVGDRALAGAREAGEPHDEARRAIRSRE